MDQIWFEMKDIRRRRLNTAVWIPLRSAESLSSLGKIAELGYRNEFYGVASIAVPQFQKQLAETLNWEDLGLAQSHRSFVEDGVYKPSDVFHGYRGLSAVALALAQDGTTEDPSEWHLHQDLVIALNLRREGDSWLAQSEGYIEVARLRRDERGSCTLLEVRAEHLKDYLCAREMALYVSSYRSRQEIMSDAAHIAWTEDPQSESSESDRWEGRVNAVHAGGFSVGSTAAVLHIGRKNLDFEEDVPAISPADENLTWRSWTIKRKGDVFYRIQGELWRTEWVEPTAQSPRVRKDELPPSTFFIVDAEGSRKAARELLGSGRWLWFRPEVMVALAHRRGGSLTWYTRDTGGVTCSPASLITFGVNKLGLVNVYAEDLARLPEWQLQVWASHNLVPEGGVSLELLAAQGEGELAETEAPETILPRRLSKLNEAFRHAYGVPLLRSHEKAEALLKTGHRFRALSVDTILSLAKDLARLTVERIDVAPLHRLVPPPIGEKWGSLKSLEKVLATRIGAVEARSIMGPLFGIHELRNADAHLTSSDLQQQFDLIGIDRTAPFVTQGRQLLDACGLALLRIAEILNHPTLE